MFFHNFEERISMLHLFIRVVDLAMNQAAKPWFHQYLDPLGTICGFVSEDRGQIRNLVYLVGGFNPFEKY